MPSATTPHALPGMILREVRKAVIGKDLVLTKVLIAFLAGGHVLMEDMPGVGKTTLAMAFSKALGLSCRRVQFTPDVLPSDLTGFSVYEKSTEKFVFQPGALFCHLLLADEINRTSSKTQAALLEAMEEGNVTVEGKTYALPQPHLVIATQNPLGCVGTQSLPESQLDRFLMRLHMGYPEIEDEVAILRAKRYTIRWKMFSRSAHRSISGNYSSRQRLSMWTTVCIIMRHRFQRQHGSIRRSRWVSAPEERWHWSSRQKQWQCSGAEIICCRTISPSCVMDVLAHRILTKGGVNVGQVLDEVLHQVPAPMPDRR